jgi:queuosine precursor transporter
MTITTNSNTENYSTNNKVNIQLGYKYLIIICMFYMSIMLCNAILTNRYIGNNSLFVLGGTFTSPFIFILDDIVAEIYGYKTARSMIIYAFLAQTVFILICQIILITPYPTFFHEQGSYNYILGPQLLRINISGFIAFITANLLNSYILSRWKILLKGRKFWLRSIGSSIFAEALYSLLAIMLMELHSIPFKDIFIVSSLSFLIKVSYSILFCIPATYIVNYLKAKTGIDAYDNANDFTPLKLLAMKRGYSYD